MKMNVLRFISLVIIFSLIPTNANAEQLKRYKIVYPDGSFVMNAGTTNPVVVEGYPSVYSILIFYHDPSGLNNSLCAAGCRPVLDSYQNDVTEGVPIKSETSTVSTPTPTPTPTTPSPQPTQSSSPLTEKGPLAGLEIELYSISQNDFQWTINAVSNNSRVITYNNFSYSWSAVGPTGTVESGNSGTSNIIESSQGQIASFHLKNLLPGVSYIITVSAINAGTNYRVSRTITTKNSISNQNIPSVDTTTATSDTKTATTDTSTVKVKIETSTSVFIQDTVTINNIQDSQTINSVVANLSVKEKEEQLQISLKANKSSVINVATEFSGFPLVITATRKGYKSITIKVKTDSEGDAQLKTTKNLSGFTVVLSIGKVKLDTDVVRK
jgi:hypothetical protein